MNLAALHNVAASLAADDSVDHVLATIVEALGTEPGVALARIWLIGPGDSCATCRAASQCTRRDNCLHLAASDGQSLDPDQDRWRNLEGNYRRIPMNSKKIGHTASTGEASLLRDLDTAWIVEPDWAEREELRSFAGQPLIFRGEILGVLCVFSRENLSDDSMGALRTFANQAASAIANARAFDEINRLTARLESENAILREEMNAGMRDLELIGESPAWRHVLDQITALSTTEATVLIQGESGTGKELVAQAIHANSPRAERPLVRVNCAAIPRELFESEFFGHVRGAFTGATADRRGRFELANGGTLFLDEVGEIPPELQSKLLRVLQEGTLERVGAGDSLDVDVRVIAATNRSLHEEVKAQRFREDLYYRLNVFPVMLPALRDRAQDIRLLAEQHARNVARKLGLPIPAFTDSLHARLGSHTWPGNVRELQNAIERAMIASRSGALNFDFLGRGESSASGAAATASNSARTYADLEALERQTVLNALNECGGRVSGPSGAAHILGIKPTTLAYRMKKLGIVSEKRISV